MSLEYPKTENLFTRNPDTHKLNMWDFRLKEFELIDKWHVTEKIDGTNMRVVYDPKNKTVDIRGRSDKANLHKDLKKTMEEMFPLELLSAQFDEYLGEQIELGTTVTIYGEGYGAGINKGGVYSQEKRFRVFDVCYHRYFGLNSWCQPSTVEMLCKQMRIPMVPVLMENVSTYEVVELVEIMKGFDPSFNDESGSDVAFLDSGQATQPEGIIARTDPYLYNELGSRIMFKLKVKDLP